MPFLSFALEKFLYKITRVIKGHKCDTGLLVNTSLEQKNPSADGAYFTFPVPTGGSFVVPRHNVLTSIIPLLCIQFA